MVAACGCTFAVPEGIFKVEESWRDFRITGMVADGVSVRLEEHCWPGAVVTGLVVEVGREIGEVLHVDLQGRRGDSMAVIVVDPCAC